MLPANMLRLSDYPRNDWDTVVKNAGTCDLLGMLSVSVKNDLLRLTDEEWCSNAWNEKKATYLVIMGELQRRAEDALPVIDSDFDNFE